MNFEIKQADEVELVKVRIARDKGGMYFGIVTMSHQNQVESGNYGGIVALVIGDEDGADKIELGMWEAPSIEKAMEEHDNLMDSLMDKAMQITEELPEARVMWYKTLLCQPGFPGSTIEDLHQFTLSFCQNMVMDHGDLAAPMVVILPSPSEGRSILVSFEAGNVFEKDLAAMATEILGDIHKYRGWTSAFTGWSVRTPKDLGDEEVEKFMEEVSNVGASRHKLRQEIVSVNSKELNGETITTVVNIDRVDPEDDESKVLGFSNEETFRGDGDDYEAAGRFSFRFQWEGHEDVKPVVTK